MKKKNNILPTSLLCKNAITYSTFFILFLTTFFFFSCTSEIKNETRRFKEGVFEIPAGKGYSKTVITRIDSIQIEEYYKFTDISNDSTRETKKTKHIDTLSIVWKNNFFYTLKMKSIKNASDNDPIYVQITKVTDSSYDFTAKVGFSKFKQTGTVYKIR